MSKRRKPAIVRGSFGWWLRRKVRCRAKGGDGVRSGRKLRLSRLLGRCYGIWRVGVKRSQWSFVGAARIGLSAIGLSDCDFSGFTRCDQHKS